MVGAQISNVSLRASPGVKRSIDITLSISAPGNSSGVELQEGLVGAQKKVTIEPGGEIRNLSITSVRTAKGNDHSGRLTHIVTAFVPDERETGISIAGSPITIEVETVP